MRKQCKSILVQKPGIEFTWDERAEIVQEYLSSNCSKAEIWRKYTGQKDENGQLLRWMRILQGDKPLPKKYFPVPNMSQEKKEEEAFENLQLKKRIAELEEELKDAKMKAIAYSTMVDIAEEELKMKIRKKFSTKPSKK